MKEPTRRSKWGEEKFRQKFASPAGIAMTMAGCLTFSSQFNPSYIFLLFFSFLLAVLTVDILFQRCANVPEDKSAWQEFFERFQHSVDATIYHIIGFPPHSHYAHLYPDIMQNYYRRLLENDRRALLAFRGKTEAEARVYLCRIAASVALDAIRKEQRELPPHASLETPAPNGLGRKPERIDTAALNEDFIVLRESIDACLEKIATGKNWDRNILIFKLMVYDGFSAKQIASMPLFSGMEPHRIDVLVSRLRAEIRKCLDRS